MVLNIAGHEHLEPVEIPGLPVPVLEPEHRPAPEHTIDVDPERLLEVLVEQSEHLERLVHLHRPLLQPVMITQGGHATDMDSGHRRAAEVHRHPVWLPMVRVHRGPAAGSASPRVLREGSSSIETLRGFEFFSPG